MSANSVEERAETLRGGEGSASVRKGRRSARERGKLADPRNLPAARLPRTAAPQRTDPRRNLSDSHLTSPPAPVAARRPPAASWWSGLSDRQPLEKCFVYFGFTVAATVVLAFGSDLVAGFPFQRASTLFDVTCVACGLALAYLSWDTQRDLH